MKIELQHLELDERTSSIKSQLGAGNRLAAITSIDGSQLITLLVSPEKHHIQCFETPITGDNYHSITPSVPQAHWFERTIWDMFGLMPEGHPRLKHTHLHEPFAFVPPPLAKLERTANDRKYTFLDVEGEGIYEIPVGPIHAGIIEPGHFRFSCSGEIILNLEIRLGYLHRGVEKRMTEVPIAKTRFLAEATASDMAVANALANATVLESLAEIDVPASMSLLRNAALEVERIAMHIADLGGLAGDVGFLAISSSMARLRGIALRLGELLGGNRFMRAYVCPGGVTRVPSKEALSEFKETAADLRKKLEPVFDFFFDNQVLADRMDKVGKVSQRLALDFGIVGVGARASGVNYDCRQFYSDGKFPAEKFELVTEPNGDVFSRAKVRIREIKSSLNLLELLVEDINCSTLKIPPALKTLPKNAVAVGITEAHRGELIHLLFTDSNGAIKRYCIKDPSVNNWTALAIAVRNNLVADFPICNKSFALSYSGHDL